MDKKDEAFLKRLLATFKAEAAEHLRALSAGLIELEQAADPAARQAVVEGVFREVHSLKGAARAVGKAEIESVCQAAESALAAAKEGGLSVSADFLDLLHGAGDLLERLLLAADRDPAAAERAAVAELRRRLEAAAAGRGETGDGAAPSPASRAGGAPAARSADAPPGPAGAAAAPAPAPAAPTPARAAVPAGEARALAELAQVVRIPASRFDAVLFQAEAMLGAKLAAGQRASELREVAERFARRQGRHAKAAAEARFLRRSLERRGGAAALATEALAPRLRRLLDELAEEDAFLKSLGARLAVLARGADRGARTLGGQVDGLLDDVKRALMLPVAAALEALPRVVRELSREQAKEADFHAAGAEVEIDRRILEELRDPLIHLVRNSIDHGIEPPAERLAAGKPRRGRVSVSAVQIEGNRIEIRVEDDGRGIDLDRLREAARGRGVAAAEAGDEAVAALVFQSGVSTSPLVTDISGRGLGLAIVREKVERLGGSAAVSSQAGRGTAFRLVLPLTLATFRGVRVRAAGEEFVFPTVMLERVVRVSAADVLTLEGREAIRVAGQAVALVRLADALGLDASAAPPEQPSPGRPETDARPLGGLPRSGGGTPDVAAAAIAGEGDRRVAFLVDEVLGEQEVLVKGLGRQLRRVRNVAGATVLGSGQVVPILYVPDLLKSARRAGGEPRAAAPARAAAEAGAIAKAILVAEDSITSRLLLKGILESAGYRVATAVDGADAYARLRTEAFDLLVSDVDMPRLSGFDLTARIRADDKLAELPVVLVTALSSREDRERGAEVGANAYLVKSSFDQGNLLAAIRRLI